MRLLLDTHVLLWSFLSPERLSPHARDVLSGPENQVFVSVASAWEVAIKQSLGKLELPDDAERWLPEMLRRSGASLLDIGLRAALRVRALPLHHNDPFDRMLIAQALEDGFTIVTRDKSFSSYGVPLMAA